MQRAFAAAVSCLAFGVFLTAAPVPEQLLTHLKLQPKANHKLKDHFPKNREGNSLASLPLGVQTLAGVKFKIEEKLIELGSTVLTEQPEKVEGIEVGRAFAHLHILHATEYGGGPNNKKGNPWFVADGTPIGKYVVHYEGDTKETIDIVYGEDVRDWWFVEGDEGPSRGKVAWVGDNASAMQDGARVRLYLTTWKNPRPGKKVVSIAYHSTKDTAAAPFCVAMTVTGK